MQQQERASAPGPRENERECAFGVWLAERAGENGKGKEVDVAVAAPSPSIEASDSYFFSSFSPLHKLQSPYLVRCRLLLLLLLVLLVLDPSLLLNDGSRSSDGSNNGRRQDRSGSSGDDVCRRRSCPHQRALELRRERRGVGSIDRLSSSCVDALSGRVREKREGLQQSLRSEIVVDHSILPPPRRRCRRPASC